MVAPHQEAVSMQMGTDFESSNRFNGSGQSHLLDLPHALLSSILERISDPITIAFVTCSCRLLRKLAKSVPFHIKASLEERFEDGIFITEGLYYKHSLTAAGNWTRRVLSTIRRQMPATAVLDLSGCWILDEDVAAVLADLRCLRFLILDGCQKLTSAVADALAVSVRSGPRALSLQRCFGLGPAAAGNLLAASAADGSRLQCMLLSHLDRLDLPRDSPLLEAHELSTGSTMKQEEISVLQQVDQAACHPSKLCRLLGFTCFGSGIHILALHNCGSLGSHELLAVGMTCPTLRILMLGGSAEGLWNESLPSDTESGAISVLIKVVEYLRFLCVLELTFFPASIVQCLRNNVGDTVEVWNFCEKESVYLALSLLGGQQQFTEHISFDIGKKENWVERMQDLNGSISLAFRAAVNCCDMRRKTPMHIAAIAGDIQIIKGLLAMGASLILKDSAGATALFSAAWDGHTEICRLLLLAGADVLSRNQAGENPLYIAALRGHSSVVEVMLSHCNANHIDWQSAEAYGDGWTPLMAAAVADRQDTAKVLLEAAGVNACFKSWRSEHGATMDCRILKELLLGSKKDTFSKEDMKLLWSEISKYAGNRSMPGPRPHILDAQNRYGQTALHIAARRASIWFVVVLLSVGASIDIHDDYKKRPVDIASAQKHALVSDILRLWGAHQKAEGTSSSSTLSSVQDLRSGYVLNKDVSKSRVTNCVWRPKMNENTSRGHC